MASYTSFLNLEKPTTSERLDVLKINSNWDKIDAGVSALNSQLAVAPVTFTSYDDLKSGIQTKAGTMASGGISSFDFRANFSTTAELPNAYYTCIIRKYDNNSYLADIISNIGNHYVLSYAGNTWRFDPQTNGLQSGQVSGITLAANSQTEVTVTLPNNYSGGNAYMAVATLEFYGTASYFSPVLIRDKSANSFVCRIHNSGTAASGVKLNWMTRAL